MDEPSLPNEPSPGGHVLGLEADRWKRGVRGAPSGSWPLHLTKPSSPDQLQLLSTAVSQSSSSGIQRTSRSHLPSLLPGSGLRTLLGGLFYLILLPRFPPSPNLHPLPPPRSQGTSLIQLLYARIEKARLFSTTLQCPHSPLSTTLSAPLLTTNLHTPYVLAKLKRVFEHPRYLHLCAFSSRRFIICLEMPFSPVHIPMYPSRSSSCATFSTKPAVISPSSGHCAVPLTQPVSSVYPGGVRTCPV